MPNNQERSGFLLKMFAAIVIVFLLLPTLIIVPLSFSSSQYLQFPPKELSLTWYRAYFADPEWIQATRLSLIIATLSTILATLIAIPATLAIVRGRLRGLAVVRSLLIAPMILPHIVIAVAFYITFSKWALTGKIVGFVAAQTVLSLPFVFLSLQGVVSKMDPELEMAASILGASRIRTFRHVTFPLLLPAIAGGAAFAFIGALDEAVVANFLSSSTSKTLAKKMFEDIDFNISPIVAAVSTLILLASMLAIVISQVAAKIRQATISSDRKPTA